ncbi:glycosyltransferase family 2 protein [Mycoplasmoides pirum]|uniref:glycosyltransferase family 2 protein n=1 Tax=Mycoplasmoides pirum TaxID=2122 RepID=UPI000697B68F|nr:glycosyltransferase family 2 protein [Mycoplasmoides pirum]
MWTSSLSLDSTLVIIPAYNEEKNIVKSIKKLQEECKYDYLIVDDGSDDKTYEICLKNYYNVIRHNTNKGLSEAMRTGFNYAWERGYKYIAQYDADGQHNPRDLVKLVNHIKNNNFDIVLGTRFAKGQRFKNIFKEITRKIFVFMFYKKTKIKISDPTNGLRVFGKKFINRYCSNLKYEVEPSTIAYAVLKNNLKIDEVYVTINDREFGKSKFDNKWETAKYVKKQIADYILATKNWD